MGLNLVLVVSCLLLAAILPSVLTDGFEYAHSVPVTWPNDSPLSVAENDTYGQQCKTSADCNTAHNQFCDSIQSKCRCLPDMAYDRFGQECRSTSCSYDGNGDFRDEYLQRRCPPGSQCYNYKCTSFCQMESYDCRTTPQVYYRHDPTYEIAFFSVLGFILLVVGVKFLSCLWRRCKRIRCKRVVTKHGQTILVSDSSTPLRGTETPIKVFSLCYCIPPVTTTEPYIHTCQQAAKEMPYPVMVSQQEYKELPPTYFGPPITDDSPLLSIPKMAE